MGVAVHKQKLINKNKSTKILIPPWFLEYGFYASLLYALMGTILGLQIDRLGIIILAGLAFFCLLGFRERALDFFKLLILPIGLGISHILIQIMYHGLSITHDYVRPFVPWIFTLIVVQALTFRRGFLQRFSIFAVFLGIALLPFLDFRAYGEDMTRVALEKGMGALSNANGLAEWFGFCTISFYVLGVVSQRFKVRLVYWMISISCLFIVMLTVSRGALIAAVIAIVLASREFLKQGFLPFFLLIILAGIAYGTGIFDQTISFYTTRATEETGRFLIWPRAFERFLSAPLTGVGGSNMLIFIPEAAKNATAHNSFLFFAMASGIIPLVFYAAYWVQAILAALLAPSGKEKTASFHLPLVVYAFIISLSGSATFMAPFVVVTIAAAITYYVRTQPTKMALQ